MSSTKTGSVSLAGRLAILLAVMAVAFLILSVTQAIYAVDRTVEAIQAIGEVTFTEESREKIDRAVSYYEALDPNLGLESRITNAETLTAARREYVRLGIKRAYLADKDGEAEELVRQYIAEARQSFDAYCSAGDCAGISNYGDLTALEEKYAAGADTPGNSTPSDDTGEDEDIELC